MEAEPIARRGKDDPSGGDRPQCLSSVSSSSSSPKLSGFKHKELRGKLAIGITANFINRKTAAEAQVAEISGVARIYNQKFFQQLLTETGVNHVPIISRLSHVVLG